MPKHFIPSIRQLAWLLIKKDEERSDKEQFIVKYLTLNKHLSPHSIYGSVVMHYARQLGFHVDIDGFCAHSLRATAATNALGNDADIAKVQQWLGHASISATRLYDNRDLRPEDSPTFKVSY